MSPRCRSVDCSKSTFLGFDLSTQKLKAVILDAKLKPLFNTVISYDADLPEFHTTDGATRGELPDEYLVNPVMWVKALDMALNSLKKLGADMSTIAAVSASAQQHGSVYWSDKGLQRLNGLNGAKALHEQIDDAAFSVNRSPIWMDGSTNKQCQEMEDVVGGALAMASITGSKCYARFTGPQIRKIATVYPEKYEQTKRISLISSFVASLFIGKIAGIDYADGSGMNLLDIRKKQWHNKCLDACAPELKTRLLNPISPTDIAGNVHGYYVKRWGFRTDCMVVACTGDNPSALAGMLLEKNSLLISLGTSDTIMMHLAEPPHLEEGHVLCHPTMTEEYMGLLCFRNGSLVRKAICDKVANGKWSQFDEMVKKTPLGNNGNMAVHFHDMEIIPLAKGTLRWSANHTSDSEDAATGVQAFDKPEYEARAVIEGQMLHHRAIAADMGFNFGNNTKIIATGGASVNRQLLQVISDVFISPVFVWDEPEAALMGAAYRARYSFHIHRENACNCGKCTDPKLTYHQFISQFFPERLKQVCTPNPNSESVYKPMLDRYRAMACILIENTDIGINKSKK